MKALQCVVLLPSTRAEQTLRRRFDGGRVNPQVTWTGSTCSYLDLEFSLGSWSSLLFSLSDLRTIFP
jgi:hypothetical protein